jgi:hypothetical protein
MWFVLSVIAQPTTTLHFIGPHDFLRVRQYL